MHPDRSGRSLLVTRSYSQLSIDLQLREIQLSAKKINTEQTASATNITKRALSSLENETISHTRKSSRFLRKNNQ